MLLVLGVLESGDLSDEFHYSNDHTLGLQNSLHLIIIRARTIIIQIKYRTAVSGEDIFLPAAKYEHESLIRWK